MASSIGHNSRGTADYSDPEGFVAIARSMRWHPVVGCGHPGTPSDPKLPAWSRYEAFQDLIMECRYKSGTVNNGGKVMAIQPGQLVGAVSWLAQRWNWTPKAVRYFLDLLQAEEMIDRGYLDENANEVHGDDTSTGKSRGKYEISGRDESGKSGANHRGKQAHIITLCNYAIYQFIDSRYGQIEKGSDGQFRGKQNANLGQHYKEEQGKVTKVEESPPTPRKRGAAKSDFTQTQMAVSDLAISLYNAEALRLDFSRCVKLDADRRARLLKRIEEIGGIDPFKVALSAIDKVPFLLGKTPPRPGQEPFRLDLERLLSTGSQLGNVLCKLIDKAAEGATPAANAPKTIDQVCAAIDAMTDAEQSDLVARHANGIWPTDKLGYSPADRRCRVRESVYRAFGITQRTYDPRGISTGQDPVKLNPHGEGKQ